MSTKKYGLEDLKKRNGPLTMARVLKSWREADDISQSDFASKLGISRANLCDYEKARKFVGPERAVSFAKILGVSAEVFLSISIQDSLRAAKLNYEVEVKKVS